ncbi:hypothetical protein [Herbaspirillum sp. ST 5-3]|uniref:hypothetical protein n=1 Tax=Herbaspirillum sp. ST 5-3 TaxID=2567936 RepID=UPI0010A466A7|nr:hypothetical protein [Herbaspirillum sp. ST 5-3]
MPFPGGYQKFSQTGHAQFEGKGIGGASSLLEYGVRLRAHRFRRTCHLTAAKQRTPPAEPKREDLHRNSAAATAPRGERSRTPQESSADSTTRQRTEPHWNDTAAARAAAFAHQEPPWQTAFQEGRPKPRRISRLMLMSGIFVIGAAVGLGVAVWFSKTGARQTPVHASQPLPAVQAPSQAGVQGARAPVRGISPDELPYDGAPPPQQAEQAPAAPPVPTLKSGEHDDVVNSGRGATTSRSKQGDSDALSAAPPKRARKPEISEAGQAALESTAPKPRAKPVERKTAKAPSKRHVPQQAAAKDKEIERIRQQAEEELKKKTSAGRVVGEARLSKRKRTGQAYGGPTMSASSQSRYAVTRATLARCERIQGLIDREKCKWRLCAGKWGKNGCPSYEPHIPAY